MTFDEWWEDFVAEHDDWKYADSEALRRAAFQAGAASRDAEVAELKTVPMKYRRMAFNAQLQAEVAELAKERDQLRAQINVLREALLTCSVGDFSTGHVIYPSFDEKLVEEAIAATPEQSLAEYRNMVIEECAKRAEACAYMSQNFNALAEELRAMKEQPTWCLICSCHKWNTGQ